MSTVPTDGDGDAGGARPMEPWAPGAKCYVCGRLVASCRPGKAMTAARGTRIAISVPSLKSPRGRLVRINRFAVCEVGWVPTPGGAGWLRPQAIAVIDLTA